MNIFLNILVGVICLSIGYLFGSIPTSVIIGKVFFHQDPRDYGSHNPGGTNAGRLWGKKVGLIVIILDMLKSILPIWLTFIVFCYVPIGGNIMLGTGADYVDGIFKNFILQYPVYWLTALGCLLGNSFPLFTNFKGGKGVATYCGIAIGSCWGITVLGAIMFFVVLFWKKYVSLSSICTVWTGFLAALIWNILVAVGVIPLSVFCFIGYGKTLVCDWYFCGYLFFGSLLVTLRHHANIARLLKHEERKVTWVPGSKSVEN